MFTSGILPPSGWVRRGGALRIPSGPKGSSGKEVFPGAAGFPARTIFLHYNHPMFLPTTLEETKQLGWDALDVILVTGDSYIDSPFIGTAVIGKVLLQAGYRVGVIAQPDSKTDADISRLGEPRLFWGVTAGSIDSMVANYTALKKPRRSDDYTPGGENTRRPDRATIV